jgi:hypothetical protein
VTQDQPSARGDQFRQVLVVQQSLREGSGAAVHIFFPIRRVGDDQVELFAIRRQLGEGGENVLCADLQVGVRQGRRVLLDERRMLLRFLDT